MAHNKKRQGQKTIFSVKECLICSTECAVPKSVLIARTPAADLPALHRLDHAVAAAPRHEHARADRQPGRARLLLLLLRVLPPEAEDLRSESFKFVVLNS